MKKSAWKVPGAFGAVLLAVWVWPGTGSSAQSAPPTPQPFPRPGAPAPPPAAPPAPPPVEQQPAQPSGPARPSNEPSEATLGAPIYPGAQFLTSFDAGRGQRYYLFGTNAGVEEMTAYYRTILKTRGDRVFEAPVMHMFEIGRFREETMAFPPSVTVKDYTWNGSAGYLNPRSPSGERFRTVIQIVPPPATAR